MSVAIVDSKFIVERSKLTYNWIRPHTKSNQGQDVVSYTYVF